MIEDTTSFEKSLDEILEIAYFYAAIPDFTYSLEVSSNVTGENRFTIWWLDVKWFTQAMEELKTMGKLN